MTGPRRRDPRELMLLALCLLAGLSYLAGAQPPNSVERSLPDWAVLLWYLALTTAAVVGLAGNLWPGRLGTALLVRMAGQILAAGPAAAYAVMALAYAGQAAIFAAALTFAWAAACLWTARMLWADVGGVR